MMMMVMMMSTAGSCGSCHHDPPRIKQVPGFEGRRRGAQHSVYGFTKERRYRCGARTRTGALRASFKFLLPTYCAGQPMHPSPVQPSQTYDVPIKTEERVRVRSTTSIHPIQYVGT